MFIEKNERKNGSAKGDSLMKKVILGSVMFFAGLLSGVILLAENRQDKAGFFGSWQIGESGSRGGFDART